jgi:glycosyltransferase involved in cell wall biosynthesis
MFDVTQVEFAVNTRPLVTVAMPVYNAGKHLRLAVLSIVEQTFTDWELLIIDDGSTDNALLEIADISDSRVRILQDGINKGLAVRLNECVDLARGKYFARMDQDDVSYPARLIRQVEFFNANPDFDLLAVRAITIDDANLATGLFPSALTHDEICAKPWRGFYFPHPTWMGTIEWFRKHRYSVPGPYFCEDQELLLRSYRSSKFGTIDETLFAYRIRENVTRWTILKIQLRHFFSSGLWHFALLAIATFVVKKCRDLLNRMGKSTHRSEFNMIDDTVLFKWNRILVDLLADAKVL